VHGTGGRQSAVAVREIATLRDDKQRGGEVEAAHCRWMQVEVTAEIRSKRKEKGTRMGEF